MRDCIMRRMNGGNAQLICALLPLVTLIGIAAAGCNSSPPAASDDLGIARLTILTKQYVSYLNSHQSRPPASEAEFKQLLTDAGSSILKKGGANTVDELFVSPRDGQPFVIEYGTRAGRLLDRGIVAYERTGKDGTHLIGRRLGFVELVDADAFRAAVPKP